MVKLVSSIEVHEVQCSDRYICIHRSNGKITGLNYIQGIGYCDEIEDKNSSFYEPDNALTTFVSAVICCLFRDKTVTIENIDDAIWAYVRYELGGVELINY